MKLPFLNRRREIRRLRRLIEHQETTLGVVYGRRRCGKSRLLRESLPEDRTVYYVGDDRESPLQRASLAQEIDRLLPGFGRVTYPDWSILLDRWWAEAPEGSILVIDEFPALVATARELPSLLQKCLDREGPKPLHLLLSGSSQRMMEGLVLDRSAPLYGRALEILKIEPLEAGWIKEALGVDGATALEEYSVWGGVPRYWELAADHENLNDAVFTHVLNPLGILYDEPQRLLLDDLRDTSQAASILSLIGRGCHRISEIAGRLGKPASSLARPMRRLTDMGLVEREVPFGVPPQSSKRSLYKIADPFLRFWFRFVEPNRSLLEARQMERVARDVSARFAQHAGEAWEELARGSVLRSNAFDKPWGPAGRWWGSGVDRTPLEIDLMAETAEGDVLVGEVKWTESPDIDRIFWDLRRRAENLPRAQGQEIHLGLWCREPAERSSKAGDEHIFTPRDVLAVMR